MSSPHSIALEIIKFSINKDTSLHLKGYYCAYYYRPTHLGHISPGAEIVLDMTSDHPLVPNVPPVTPFYSITLVIEVAVLAHSNQTLLPP